MRQLLYIFGLSANIRAEKKPNIVVIVADDLGKHDVSMHGADIYTPNLDMLARDGVLLNNYYVQPVCSPTRGSLMTGRYPYRLGLQHENLVGYRPAGLPLDEYIMPQYMKECGYKTYMVGKWQLGFFKDNYLPWKRGFDEFFGQLLGGQDYYSRRKCLKLRNYGNLCGYDLRTEQGPVRDTSMKYQPFLYADKAREKFFAHNKTDPLYMYVAFQSVHRPLQAPQQYVSLYNDNVQMSNGQRVFAGMVTALDAAVGEIVDGLKDSGLWNNTLIYFSNDNGREDDSDFVLKGGKNDFWQGGITGYGFFSGPAIPRNMRGKKMNDLTHVSDVLPTMLSAAKCHTLPPKVLDGHDLWSRLEGDSLGQDEKRKEIIMQINPLLRLWEEDTRFQNSTWDTRTQGVIIDGDYKLIVGSHSVLRRKASDYQTVWLFNIKNDPQEANDLSGSKPNLTHKLLHRLYKEMDNVRDPWHPLPDPASDPALHGDFWGPYRSDFQVFASTDSEENNSDPPRGSYSD